MRKVFTVLIVLIISFSAFGAGVQEGETAAAVVKNPDTFVYATYGTIDSLDIVKAYDTASWTNMRQIYEPLIGFKGTATDEYEPLIAEEVPTVANGGILEGGKVYRFKIKKGIKFHSGDIVTPEDVEYSFERSLVNDPDGGPVWIWAWLFLGEWGTRDGDGNINVDFADIDAAIEVDGDYVVFTLNQAFPPFLGVIANTWASVLNKSFVIENGGWDGTEATWKEYNNPEEDAETLWDVADGTGPYKLERWEKGVELVVTRFEDYWGKKPAIAKGIYKVVEEWTTRKLMLLQGDADLVTVDALYYPEMDQESGLTVYMDLPSLAVGGMGLNQAIAAQDNPNIYSGKLDGKGVPPDFFADKNVRIAFMYAWDEETFLRDIMNGTAMDPVTPIVSGLPFKDTSVKRLPFDLAKSEEYFKKAFDGQLWEKGFKLDLLANSGNEVRNSGNRLLAEAISSINPKFQLNTRTVEWSVYVDNVTKKTMPLFFIGWAPDYPDPDNYANPYMHSSGYYANRVGYSNPRVDKLIEAAAVELDPAKRKAMYSEIQHAWIDDAVGIMTHQSMARRYFKDWVQGHYYNPMQSSAYDLLADLEKTYNK